MFFTSVFSAMSIKTVKVSINDGTEIDCTNIVESQLNNKSPLYIAPWAPKQLPVGAKHSMKVVVVLSTGLSDTTITKTREFILDTQAMANEGTLDLPQID